MGIGKLAETSTKKHRTAYGLLILSTDETLRLHNQSALQSVTAGESAAYVLCVQQYVSYPFRAFLYKLARYARDSSKRGQAIEEIVQLCSKLSSREHAIIRNQGRFSAEVRRTYANGREKYISDVLHAYSELRHRLSEISPSRDAKERRWSPPKGGAFSSPQETHLEVIAREVLEETGLSSDKYTITDPRHPLVHEYTAYGKSYKLVLYIGRLTADVPFALFNESPVECGLPAPMMQNEIARTAYIPVSMLDEYLPAQYGDWLKTELSVRLTGKQLDIPCAVSPKYDKPSGAPSSPTTIDPFGIYGDSDDD